MNIAYFCLLQSIYDLHCQFIDQRSIEHRVALGLKPATLSTMSMLKGGENRKRRKHLRVHGFLEQARREKQPASGSHTLKRRRTKGRHRIAVAA